MSIQQIILNTISDLKTELSPSSSKSIKTLGYYQAGDGGHGCYYWTPFQLKINDSNGYAIGEHDEIFVESLSEPIEEGSVIEFTGGGLLTLRKDAAPGDTKIAGGVASFALVDNEEGGLQDDSGLTIKPTFGGFSGAGRWGLVHEGTIYAKQFGIKTDGTEQASDIQSAIMSCPKGCTFRFNPGTYVVENEIVITSKKRLKIDGNGAFLDASSWNSSGTSYLITFDAKIIDEAFVSAVTRYTITHAGLTTTPVPDQWIYIHSSELIAGDFGVGRSYSRSQSIKVASVVGNVITVDATTPLLFAGGSKGDFGEFDNYKYEDLGNNTTKIILYDYNEDIEVIRIRADLNNTSTDLTQGGINMSKVLNYTISDCSIQYSSRDCVTCHRSIFGRILNCNFTTNKNQPDSGNYGIHLRYGYHIIVAHNTIDAYKALDVDTSFYVTFDGNNCNGAIRPHGSLYVTAINNIVKGSNFPWRSGLSRIEGNTFYCHGSNGQGLSFGEMAGVFGQITIKDNLIISTREYDGGEDEYAIDIPSTTLSNLIIDGNIIRHFARGINVTGGDNNGIGQEKNNKNLQITNNTIEVYFEGISGLRYNPALVKGNVLRKLWHSEWNNGVGAGINLSSGGAFTLEEIIIKGNSFFGYWSEAIDIRTQDYEGIIIDDNYYDSNITEEIAQTSKVSTAFVGRKVAKQIYTQNVERVSFAFDDETFSSTEKLTTTFIGDSTFPVESIKVRILMSKTGSSIDGNKSHIEKIFFIAAMESSFRVNDSTLISSYNISDNELVAVHLGSNYEYSIELSYPSAISADPNRILVDFEVLTSRPQSKNSTQYSIMTTEPQVG